MARDKKFISSNSALAAIFKICSPVLNMWTNICKRFCIVRITMHNIPWCLLYLQFIVPDSLQLLNEFIILVFKSILLLQHFLLHYYFVRVVNLQGLEEIGNAISRFELTIGLQRYAHVYFISFRGADHYQDHRYRNDCNILQGCCLI